MDDREREIFEALRDALAAAERVRVNAEKEIEQLREQLNAALQELFNTKKTLEDVRERYNEERMKVEGFYARQRR